MVGGCGAIVCRIFHRQLGRSGGSRTLRCTGSRDSRFQRSPFFRYQWHPAAQRQSDSATRDLAHGGRTHSLLPTRLWSSNRNSEFTSSSTRGWEILPSMRSTVRSRNSRNCVVTVCAVAHGQTTCGYRRDKRSIIAGNSPTTPGHQSRTNGNHGSDLETSRRTCSGLARPCRCRGLAWRSVKSL